MSTWKTYIYQHFSCKECKKQNILGWEEVLVVRLFERQHIGKGLSEVKRRSLKRQVNNGSAKTRQKVIDMVLPQSLLASILIMFIQC